MNRTDKEKFLDEIEKRGIEFLSDGIYLVDEFEQIYHSEDDYDLDEKGAKKLLDKANDKERKLYTMQPYGFPGDLMIFKAKKIERVKGFCESSQVAGCVVSFKSVSKGQTVVMGLGDD